MIIEYEKIVEDYNDKLLTKLRGHTTSFDYLEMWVPDENPVKSILNMVEAAEAYGRDDLKLQVSNITLNDEGLKELVLKINEIGKANIEHIDDKIIINVLSLQRSSSNLLENLHPAFHRGVSEIAEQIDHYCDLELLDDEVQYDATEQEVHLCVAVKGNSITRAAFSGEMSGQQKVVLEVFCRIIEDIPLQEAADHAALYTLCKLYDRRKSKPVDGIMMVCNVDPIFELPEKLIREINAMYRKRNNVNDVSNFWNPHLSKDWLILSEQGKIERLMPIIKDFSDENKLKYMDIKIEGISKDIKVTVSLSDNVASNEQPSLLMALEDRLRSVTGKRIEIYMQERQDANRIRRIKIS